MSRPPIVVATPPHADVALRVDVEGGLVRLHCAYKPEVIAEVRALPGRRYLPKAQEWVAPARRDILGRLAALTEQLGERAEVTRAARSRLDRACPGLIERDAEGFSVRFGYTRRRLDLIREVAERTWDPLSRSWRVPATRAGALGLLALLDSDEFTGDPSVRGVLERLGSATPCGPDTHPRDEGRAQVRSSPTAHWRHVTRGPIFNANTRRHRWIEGVGWCVRVRVDPERRRAKRAGR
jgi:hypothetical protein